MIRLEPMDFATYEAWREESIREYAQEKIEAGTWPQGETFARENGCYSIQLHVHGANTGARDLYRRAGFDETDVTMLKRVDS